MSDEFVVVSGKFLHSWKKGSLPIVHDVIPITNSHLQRRWEKYRKTLRNQACEEYYHGTRLACNITQPTFCSNVSCGICRISCSGLDPQCIGTNIHFQRFGRGFYLAPNSSKCHDYIQGAYGYRAMLLCDVLPGRKYRTRTNDQSLTAPPPGYDSVYGEACNGSKLNYPEIVVYKPQAVLPRYIIVYKKDWTARLT